MNVTSFITTVYENNSNWTLGENKPNSNPIKANTKPIKANKMPKQTQYEPNQTQPVVSLSNLFQRQKNAALHLFAVGSRTEKIMLFKSLSGKWRLKVILALYPIIW